MEGTEIQSKIDGDAENEQMQEGGSDVDDNNNATVTDKS